MASSKKNGSEGYKSIVYSKYLTVTSFKIFASLALALAAYFHSQDHAKGTDEYQVGQELVGASIGFIGLVALEIFLTRIHLEGFMLGGVDLTPSGASMKVALIIAGIILVVYSVNSSLSDIPNKHYYIGAGAALLASAGFNILFGPRARDSLY